MRSNRIVFWPVFFLGVKMWGGELRQIGEKKDFFDFHDLINVWGGFLNPEMWGEKKHCSHLGIDLDSSDDENNVTRT